MSQQITHQVADQIAKAAFADRDAFGRLPAYAVERHAEEAGVTVQDPVDGADSRSVSALAAYIRRSGTIAA